MKQSIRRRNPKIVGIGGMKCYCCTCGKPKKSKKLISRIERRKNKQVINYEED
jgi:hypothetical protein